MLEQVQPVLTSRDVDASIGFYVGRLGFTLAFHAPAHPAYAVLRRDHVELHVQWNGSAESATGDRPMYRFLVSDIESLFAEFESTGVFHAPTALRDTPWGTREFAFHDPDRNGLTFYVPVAPLNEHETTEPPQRAPRAMTSAVVGVTLVVRDYDEAIAFFTGAVGFRLLEDAPLPGGKRWVRVAPDGPAGTSLLLARAATPEQERAIGNQAGGRVAFFLQTNDFARAYERMRTCGVRFLEAPREEPYGTVAVFADLYGNAWDLIEPRVTPAD